MIGRTHVLDASAVLAAVHHEPGGDEVRALLPRACVSSVNWAEVMQKARQRGLDSVVTAAGLYGQGLQVVAFSLADAEMVAALWERTRDLGLSLADRACLALAERLHLPAVIADREWQSVGGVTVQLIR